METTEQSFKQECIDLHEPAENSPLRIKSVTVCKAMERNSLQPIPRWHIIHTDDTICHFKIHVCAFLHILALLI
jgi:hypothetical protein